MEELMDKKIKSILNLKNCILIILGLFCIVTSFYLYGQNKSKVFKDEYMKNIFVVRGIAPYVMRRLRELGIFLIFRERRRHRERGRRCALWWRLRRWGHSAHGNRRWSPCRRGPWR